VPRKPRIDAAGAIQHVVARGNAGSIVVMDDDDRRTLINGLERTADRYRWRVHAYCLMDTHVHLVVETPEPTLGSGMQRLLGGYAFEFNRRHARYGHLFAGPYTASLISTEAHAIEACAYIVLNPVRAGMVVDAADWPWSSYRASAGLVTGLLFVETRLIPSMLHPNRKRAQALYRELVRDAAESPRTGSG
jgi:REP element-mobilizing transposase RayT